MVPTYGTPMQGQQQQQQQQPHQPQHSSAPTSPVRTSLSSNPVSPVPPPQSASRGGGGGSGQQPQPPLVPRLAGASAGQQPPPLPATPTLPPKGDAGIMLGVEALERQQAELERRRAEAAAAKAAQAQAEAAAALQAQKQQQQQAAAALQAQKQKQQQKTPQQAQQLQSSSLTSNASSASSSQYPPPTAPSSSSRTPPPPRPPPSQPGLSGPAGSASADGDDDTEPSSDLMGSASGTGAGMTEAAGGGGGRANKPIGRSSSFGKFLRTPLKLKHSLSTGERYQDDPAKKRSSWAGDTGRQGPLGSAVLMSSLGGGVGGTGDGGNIDDLDEEGMWADHEVKPLVYGYLHKLGRNGQWQRRFFETDGECLTYYKSRKRIKLLATLDLLKVGDIQVDPEDTSGCTFTIQVADRPYYLQASNKSSCKDWVINLNRVKEARMQIGGYKLVEPQFHHGEQDGSDRNRSESDEYAARVVMVANRGRTRAMSPSETEEGLKQMLRESGINGGRPPLRPPAVNVDALPQGAAAQDGQPLSPGSAASVPEGSALSPHYPSQRSPRIINQLPPVILARWQKRGSNLQRLKWRLTRWARRINMLRCMALGEREDVLTQGVGPPGLHNASADYGEHGSMSDIDEKYSKSGGAGAGAGAGGGEGGDNEEVVKSVLSGRSAESDYESTEVNIETRELS